MPAPNWTSSQFALHLRVAPDPITRYVALEVRGGSDAVVFEMDDYTACGDDLPEPEKLTR
jgi:hypothetical protein